MCSPQPLEACVDTSFPDSSPQLSVLTGANDADWSDRLRLAALVEEIIRDVDRCVAVGQRDTIAPIEDTVGVHFTTRVDHYTSGPPTRHTKRRGPSPPELPPPRVRRSRSRQRSVALQTANEASSADTIGSQRASTHAVADPPSRSVGTETIAASGCFSDAAVPSAAISRGDQTDPPPLPLPHAADGASSICEQSCAATTWSALSSVNPNVPPPMQPTDAALLPESKNAARTDAFAPDGLREYVVALKRQLDKALREHELTTTTFRTEMTASKAKHEAELHESELKLKRLSREMTRRLRDVRVALSASAAENASLQRRLENALSEAEKWKRHAHHMELKQSVACYKYSAVAHTVQASLSPFVPSR